MEKERRKKRQRVHSRGIKGKVAVEVPRAKIEDRFKALAI